MWTALSEGNMTYDGSNIIQVVRNIMSLKHEITAMDLLHVCWVTMTIEVAVVIENGWMIHQIPLI